MATIRDEEIDVVLENIDYIPGYKEAEIERRTNELQRQSNEEKRETLYNQMKDDLEHNRFNGATFTPTVDADCNIIWTNDKGLPNPETVNVKGAKGDKGDTGAKGDKGDTGNTGATGNGISKIEKTNTSGLVDTYTITYTNGTTTTFTVTNGQNGTNGTNGQDGYSPTATVSKSGNTTTITITDKNGTTTESIQEQDVSGKEDKSNKVTSISSQSTDTQYPSAKCIYDLIGNIDTVLATLTTVGGNS